MAAFLIKSHGSQFGCSVTNCSRHNNLTIKRPAWTASKNVEKVGEIETRLYRKGHKKDTPRMPVGPSLTDLFRLWHRRESTRAGRKLLKLRSTDGYLKRFQ
jgi:hypothetical protein